MCRQQTVQMSCPTSTDWPTRPGRFQIIIFVIRTYEDSCVSSSNCTHYDDSKKYTCCLIMNLTSICPWFLEHALNSWNFPSNWKYLCHFHEPLGPYLSNANKMAQDGAGHSTNHVSRGLELWVISMDLLHGGNGRGGGGLEIEYTWLMSRHACVMKPQ